jgi:hypothetical protein
MAAVTEDDLADLCLLLDSGGDEVGDVGWFGHGATMRERPACWQGSLPGWQIVGTRAGGPHYDVRKDLDGGNVRKHVMAVALVLGMSACGSGGSTPAPAGDQPWLDGTQPADSESRIGDAGSLCPLPVSFGVAKSWKAQSVKGVEDGGLLTHQGGFVMACEVDAKPAGNLGFLRVWTSTKTGGDARKALEEFVAAGRNVTVPTYRDAQVGPVTGAEVTYVVDNPEMDVKKRERALVVTTPHGAVLLHLGGLDTGEHEHMLPAYVLAKQTLKIAA